MIAHNDTIAAIATPPGRGAIGIIRISGPGVPEIANAVLGCLPKPRHATYQKFLADDGVVIDRGIVLYFPKPNSYTGEPVLELQGHGGPVVLDMLVTRILSLGARLARPGEFSERAFLNGKLDLAQAEAIADLITSGSQAAVRSAMRSLQGDFSSRIHQLVKDITNLRMFVEAAIDFPEEEIDFLADKQIVSSLATLLGQIKTIVDSAQQGCLLRDGIRIVLAGPPNVGKSSLLNALAEIDRAIVSDAPGTTRDIVDQHIQIDGLPLHLLDTAGLRETEDTVEHEGVSRARSAMEEADRVLVVVDDRQSSDLDGLLKQLPAGVAVTMVHNKIDLSGRSPEICLDIVPPRIAVSAKNGAGLDLLRDHLKQSVGYENAGESTFIARRRHLDALRVAHERLLAGNELLIEQQAGELLAEELRLAQHAVSEITGEVTSEDLLARIFSSFCIGK